MISPVLIAYSPDAAPGLEASAGNIIKIIIIYLVLFGGVAQGVLAYTGRWRSWHYNGTGMHGVAPPLTGFWASVTVLIFWTGALTGAFNAGAFAVFLLLLVVPPGLLTCVSFWWIPRFARPRWIAEEEARLLAKRDRPSQSGGA
ncbi:hypothetical protein ACQP1W_49755 [Spirillospora sp. CA-255316]